MVSNKYHLIAVEKGYSTSAPPHGQSQPILFLSEAPCQPALRNLDESVGGVVVSVKQQPIRDEKLSMDDAMSAIRRAIIDEEAGEMTLTPAEPRTSGEEAGAKRIPEAGLLS